MRQPIAAAATATATATATCRRYSRISYSSWAWEAPIGPGQKDPFRVGWAYPAAGLSQIAAGRFEIAAGQTAAGQTAAGQTAAGQTVKKSIRVLWQGRRCRRS
jgi:hypothetical protein